MSIHFKDACISFKINFIFWLSDKILANVHRGYGLWPFWLCDIYIGIYGLPKWSPCVHYKLGKARPSPCCLLEFPIFSPFFYCLKYWQFYSSKLNCNWLNANVNTNKPGDRIECFLYYCLDCSRFFQNSWGNTEAWHFVMDYRKKKYKLSKK